MMRRYWQPVHDARALSRLMYQPSGDLAKEMNLSKIERVNVDQSIMGRILNYGSITIIGTGGTKEVFNDIASPMKFRKAFQEIDISQEWFHIQ